MIGKQFFIGEVQTTFVLRQPKSSKPTNVYLACRVQGQQIKLATGVKVYPEHWNRQKQEAYVSFRLSELDNRNNEIVNSRINELRICFSSYIKYLCDNPDKIVDCLDLLRGYIYKDNISMKKTKQSLNATIVMQQIIEEQDIVESSKKIKIGIINKFAKFLTISNIPNTWDSINCDTLNRYQEYLITENKAHKTINNNLGVLMSIFKLVNKRMNIPFKWAESNLDSFEIIKNRTNRNKQRDKQVTLNEEDIKRMYNYQISGNNAEKYTEIKDLFVLQCLVGQRISDMSKFFNKEYTLNEETKTVSIIQQKTKRTAIIPLFPLANEILDKYKDGLKYITVDRKEHQTINRIIRNIAKQIGLTDTVTYQEQRGKMVIDIEKPFCEMIHTHTARHTFITIMCRNGIPKDDVIIATGHEDTTMIEEVYEHLNEKDKENKISNAVNQLVGDIFNMGNNKLTLIKREINKRTNDNVSAFTNPEKYQQLFYDIDIFSYLFKTNKDAKGVLFNNDIYSISHIKYYLETEIGENDRDILTKKISNFIYHVDNINNDKEIDFVRNRAKELGINGFFYKAEEILLL